MATYIVRLRDAPPFGIEGAGIDFHFPEGSHSPVITIVDEDSHILAIMPGDAVRTVYLEGAERKTEGGPVPL